MTDFVPQVSPELPPAIWRTVLAVLRRLPQGALSRSFGALMDTPLPRPVRKSVLSTFARALHIDASQAELPLQEYSSINEFFVRKLKPGARAWPLDPRAAGSPVEAVVGKFGAIENGTLLQAKGRNYTVAELLDDAGEAKHFDVGSFITLYLSPRHYHRIHAPLSGSIDKARHIPGRLLPVNAPAVAHIDKLFAVNERLVTYLNSDVGRIAVVAVGAYNVGRISAAFDPRWTKSGWVTNRAAAQPETHAYEPALGVNAGDEIMAFHLGSTVVMLLEKRAGRFDAAVQEGAEMLLGQRIMGA